MVFISARPCQAAKICILQPRGVQVSSRDFFRGGRLKPRVGIWRSFWCLSDFERSIALEAACGLVATRVGLSLLGFRRWKNELARFARHANRCPATSAGPGSVAASKEIARIAAATARNLFFRANCLERSLTLWWLLSRRGIASELRFGARKESTHFEAHAWVELDGTVLSDAGEVHLHFVPFESH